MRWPWSKPKEDSPPEAREPECEHRWLTAGTHSAPNRKVCLECGRREGE